MEKWVFYKFASFILVLVRLAIMMHSVASMQVVRSTHPIINYAYYVSHKSFVHGRFSAVHQLFVFIKINKFYRFVFVSARWRWVQKNATSKGMWHSTISRTVWCEMQLFYYMWCSEGSEPCVCALPKNAHGNASSGKSTPEINASLKSWLRVRFAAQSMICVMAIHFRFV